MKTYFLKNQNSELKSRPEQRSTNGRGPGKLSKIDFKLRHQNRQLPTEQLLKLLQAEAPRLLEVAKVVGAWVWIQFAAKQTREVTASLAQLGFSWNRRRKTWQHPCGVFKWTPGDCDPRHRFGIRSALTVLAA